MENIGKRGNINLIACGGAGTNILAKVTTELSGMGEEFSSITNHVIDMTDKSIQSYPELLSSFTKVVSKRQSVGEYDGTGGECVDPKVVKDMNIHIREYLDDAKLSLDKGNYNVVLFSGAGGSGSKIGPLVVKALIEKDMTVIPVIVGDSSNLLNLEYTITTLNNIEATGRATNTAIATIYYNNTLNGSTTPSTELAINEKIVKMLKVLSLYTSGNVNNIDHQDMVNFFNARNYTKFNVQPGMYSIALGVGELKDKSTIITRTVITDSENNVAIKSPLLHNKTGVANDKVSGMFDKYPMYLRLRNGDLSNVVKGLKDNLNAMEELRTSTYDYNGELNSVTVDEESGMML